MYKRKGLAEKLEQFCKKLKEIFEDLDNLQKLQSELNQEDSETDHEILGFPEQKLEKDTNDSSSEENKKAEEYAKKSKYLQLSTFQGFCQNKLNITS